MMTPVLGLCLACDWRITMLYLGFCLASTDRRGMTLQMQQISSWQSVYGSKMGDPMSPQLLGGFKQTIPMTAITQVKKPAFKKPWRPAFQVAPPARTASLTGLTMSSMQPGDTATTYVPKPKLACVESPSPDAPDRK